MNVNQETFQRAQETQVEHRFPGNSPGIVPVPRGSRGPRSLYLKRNGDSFGFTLRHFIVYPPESIAEHDDRYERVGALMSPMDTIFVKHVKERTPAKQAGLQRGDRLVAVNGISLTDKSYQQVVQLIQNSPEYLHLLVVPKEEDVLQRFFAETAYNPISNQPSYQEPILDKQNAQEFLAKTINRRPEEFHVDANSWRYLQQPYYGYGALQKNSPYGREQRSADNLTYREEARPRPNVGQQHQEKIYAEIHHPHEINFRQRSRAQPQVPLYKKMGRRASEGSALSEREQYHDPSSDFSSVNSDLGERRNINMKAMYKPYYTDTSQNSDMSGLTYPNTAGCRLSLDVGRRESSSSLSSSLADGSKDSLTSFDSTSTLTGHETDDSAINARYRKSFQQKEEFLRNPSSNTVESALIQREFYGRPKKMEKSVWPPNEPFRQDSPSRTVKPTHQNFSRVKNDLENERDLVLQTQNGTTPNGRNTSNATGFGNNNVPQAVGVKSPREHLLHMDRVIPEGSVPPNYYDNIEQINGSTTIDEYRDKLRPTQIVHKRARDFETGNVSPEDKTNFSRSELARLSSKRLVPNVTEIAFEYETRRDPSVTSTTSGGSTVKRIQRDSRSLDSSGSNASSGSVNEVLLGGKLLSGNVTISSGSKYIHCPPPSEYGKQPTTADKSGNEATRLRARSNSAESTWVAAVTPGDAGRKRDGAKRISRQDAIVDRSSNKTRDHEDMDHASSAQPPYGDLPPLIPVPVERMSTTPTVSITPSPSPVAQPKAVRPTQLDLEGPIRPARHLKPPSSTVDTPMRRSISPVNMEDKPVVVKRRNKPTNIVDDERITRRESYLKATEGGRMPFDGEGSDGGDVSPQVLRSAHRRWRPPMFPGDIQQLRKLFEDAASSLGGSPSGNSSSSASLDREKGTCCPLEKEKEKYSISSREGYVHCKILEIDGKRAGDRSWKQFYYALKGPMLYLYKDRHHQSPIGTDAVEHSLASGIDMRTSLVNIPEDYTKRKHVLRVSSVKPCRSEFLLQAESEEFGDLFKALQEQVAITTEVEARQDPLNGSNQQAVPQTIAAKMTVQVPSHLSPQPSNKSKSSSSRNRSPTGQSPVSKTRKPSQVNDPSTSPKSKTWAGRMVKQFRKIQGGASSPSSPTAPEGSTFGIPLEQCLPSNSNPYVPRFVEVCTDIVDAKGLQLVGIYRVPGNSASITALTEEINRNYEDIPQDDHRWNDIHVVSSLLKSYFRKMPDSLVTMMLYPRFIKADKIENPKLRLEELRKLVKNLPPHNYHTLKHLVEHLTRVVDNSNVNLMEAKNLAIVFGPTIVRPEGENMESLVHDMTHQCKIVETLLTSADWFFSDSYTEEDPPAPLVVPDSDDFEPGVNHALLLDNIGKYEALTNPKEKNMIFSSIISAAHRKVKKKTNKSLSIPDTKEEATSPTSLKAFSPQPYSPNDLKDSPDGKMGMIPTTVQDFEKQNQTASKDPWFNYSKDRDGFHERVERFRQETNAMLQMPRKTEISVFTDPRAALSSSASNVNQQTLMRSNKPADLQLLKTHSASNVFTFTANNTSSAGGNNANSRNSFNSMDSSGGGGGPFSVQYVNKPASSDNNSSDLSSSYQYSSSSSSKKQYSDNRNSGHHGGGVYRDAYSEHGSDRRGGRSTLRRGSSVENINSSSMDLNANGNLKKVKYENENDLSQRTGSLDSLNKLHSTTDDESDLVTAMTKIYDAKLKEKQSHPNLLSGEDLPFADESPEKHPPENAACSDKENIPHASDLYKNPSLHKSQYSSASKLYKQDLKFKESKRDKEKDEDTKISETVPDNERHISTTTHNNNNKLTVINSNKLNSGAPTSSKLKRSESLNKPERTVSPLNNKLKRSESLNKTGDKLKRSDSLTKNEKTESNINKRRETVTSGRKSKELAKLKRKNGMPDRSIKRRHTVGGTKDPDKVTWYRDNKYQEEIASTKESSKEKNLRTSSPDLSSARRERLLLEINLIGPENMVMALRQHLIGARPQSFPESTVFKVPLESHV